MTHLKHSAQRPALSVRQLRGQVRGQVRRRRSPAQPAPHARPQRLGPVSAWAAPGARNPPPVCGSTLPPLPPAPWARSSGDQNI